MNITVKISDTVWICSAHFIYSKPSNAFVDIPTIQTVLACIVGEWPWRSPLACSDVCVCPPFLCGTFSSLFICSMGSFCPQVVTTYPWLPLGNKETDSLWWLWWSCPLSFLHFVCWQPSLTALRHLTLLSLNWKCLEAEKVSYMNKWPLKCSTKCHLGLHQLRYTMQRL